MKGQKRKRYMIVGNWKSYLSLYEAVSLSSVHRVRFNDFSQKYTLVILPSFVALVSVIQILRETDVLFGAQDCSAYPVGAYTGEITASVLKEVGCTYALIGHSERRNYFQETDEIIAKKYEALMQAGLQPILCVGEQNRENNIQAVKEVVKKQLAFLLNMKKITSVYIAYEPAWAISGENKKNMMVDPDVLQGIILYIRSLFTTKIQISILYGGSVQGETIKQYKALKALDGFLIGKASTNFQALEEIIAMLEEK